MTTVGCARITIWCKIEILTTTPIVKVRSPSSRNSQNQPGFPPTPRMLRIAAASNDEITLATLMITSDQVSNSPEVNLHLH